MPRMSYVSSESFRAGQQDHSPENENYDFCRGCWVKAIQDPREAMNVPADVSDDWISYPDGFDPAGEDHPDYAEWGDYTCHSCGRTLGTEDA